MEMQLGREQLCHLGKSPRQSHFCWQLNTHIFKEDMAVLSAAGGLGASTVNEHFPAERSSTGRWACFYSLDNLYITPTKPGNESVPGLVTKLPTCKLWFMGPNKFLFHLGKKIRTIWPRHRLFIAAKTLDHQLYFPLNNWIWPLWA